MDRLMKTTAIMSLLALAMPACTPYSPPVRSALAGAPGGLRAGDVEIGGAVTRFATGGPGLAIAITDWAAVEGGAELHTVDKGKWGFAYAGGRFTWNGRDAHPRKREKNQPRGAQGAGPAADVGVGFGVGAGTDPDSGFAAPGGGGYLDAGFAYHTGRWFAVFARAAVQETQTRGLPATTWWHVGAGPELNLGPLRIYAAGGGAGFVNGAGREQTWIVDGGLAVRFDAAISPR
jgi:hypothetical protein